MRFCPQNSIKKFAKIFCPVAALAYGGVAPAEPYDNFDDTNFLSSDLWRFQKNISNAIDDGKLRILQRRGDSSENNNIRFANPESVNAIQATVNVQENSVLDGLARARIVAQLCDLDGTANGNTNEIFSEISVFRDDGGELGVLMSLFRCDNENCSEGTSLLDERDTFGVPELDTDYVLSLAFDSGTNTYTFGFDGETVDAGPEDIPELANCSSSNGNFKAIGSRISQPEGDSSEAGKVVALFDDVMVNGAAYDDFGLGFIDTTKWNERDTERTILIEEDGPDNNAVHIGQRRGESRNRSNNLEFADPDNIDSVRATLRVVNTEIVNPNEDEGRVRVRLTGAMYNDGRSTGPDDQTGDLYLQASLARNFIDDVNEQPYGVDCGACVCEDAECSTDTCPVFTRFATWEEGETYTIEFGVDRETNSLVCKFDDTSFTYRLQPTDPQPAALAVNAFKALATRIDELDGPGEIGSISAVFDDVETNFDLINAVEEGALVGITESAQAQGANGLNNISYNGLVTAEGIRPGFVVSADAPADSRFVITAQSLGLPDPQVTLFEITDSGNVEIASNDNCEQDLTADIGTDVRDGTSACLSEVLSQGFYFVEVSDVGGGSGDVLFGVTQPVGSDPALLNISYNGLVAMNGIKPGFSVGQTQTYALTVEGQGPSDPQLLLYQITEEGNQLVAHNDECEIDLTADIGKDIRNGVNPCLLISLNAGLYFIDILNLGDENN